MLKARHFTFLLVLLSPCQGLNAATPSFEDCLLGQLRSSANDNLSVLQVKRYCEQQQITASETSNPLSSGIVPAPSQLPLQPRFNEFFEPYKESYLLFGSMDTSNAEMAFSGETLDIKFELGMKFRLFPDQPVFESLAPVYFGYSQKSWWDIAESSAPFKEHNYNPEVFWDYSKTSNKNGLNFLGRYIDQIGYEHQSNGLDGTGSRSWDRLYISRGFQLGEKFNIGLKAWNMTNSGNNNPDITDYLGNLQLNASFKPNSRLTVNLEALKGHQTEKYSYQLDFVYRIPEWVNGEFILSYYEGYGEALISYNEKTSSLRAGLYFPIAFGGRQ